MRVIFIYCSLTVIGLVAVSMFNNNLCVDKKWNSSESSSALHGQKQIVWWLLNYDTWWIEQVN